MNEAKEKAKELVEKYAVWTWNDTICNYEVAVQCALICVDEIIKHIEFAYHNEDIIKGSKLFWQEVRQEILML